MSGEAWEDGPDAYRDAPSGTPASPGSLHGYLRDDTVVGALDELDRQMARERADLLTRLHSRADLLTRLHSRSPEPEAGQ